MCVISGSRWEEKKDEEDSQTEEGPLTSDFVFHWLASIAYRQEFDDLFRSVRLVQAALEQVHGAEAAMDPESEDSLPTISGVQFEGVGKLWEMADS